jgi:tRNA A-37 threonylcarbamoyl transferase component Bud32
LDRPRTPELVEQVNGEMTPVMGDFPAGARIANYRIDGLIGRGGMAVVYRATDVRLDRPVALKILDPELASDDAFRERFIRESRAGAGVDHPHVIPVFEAGDANGVLFIAMRYVAGSDVRALIEREGRLSAQRTVEIVSQVASALDAAHAHGTVHRDVKPANMLIGLSDHVYLSDFGLSKQSVSAPTLTMTGQFLGTLDYMSPEQIGGRPIDGRTDLYALGCAAFEMLTGEPPFRRDANLAVMWAQVSAPPPSVRTWRPELSPAVDRVVGRALAKAPEDRQATCTEFAAQLRDACSVRLAAAATSAPVTERVDRFGAAEATVTSGGPDHGLVPAQVYRPGGQDYAPGGPQYAVIGPHPGTGGPDGFGHPPTGQRPSPPRRRGRAVPILVSCLVVAALAAAAVLVLHLRNEPSPQATPPHSNQTVPAQTSGHGSTVPGGSSGPASVVRAFFQAINSHDYARAWHLNASSRGLSSYAAFKNGYAQTAHDSVTIMGVSGDVVSVDLAAAQTNGTTKYFQGSYTVRDGSIVASSIRQIS